jgi:protein transport protein SEC13
VLLASCSFDGSVWIHKEQAPGDWTVIHAARQLHESSVNGVAFGPHEYGLIVAAASSDGRVSVLRHQADQTWTVQYLEDCRAGVNAVSWAPYGAFSDPTKPDAPDFPRIVTAGCDNRIRFWVCQDGSWIQEDSPETGHSDWVRDVAWAPTLLPRENTVASCSEDKTVLIWTKSGDQHWKSTLLNTFDQPVWRVSWSVTGHLLAFSSGDNNVTLWKAGLDGTWTQVSTVEEEQQPQG